MSQPIYLDHNATSPLLPDVLEAMTPWLGVAANPASAHRLGQRAAVAVEEARELVARLVGGVPEGVVFTSGATEANVTFLRGSVPGGALVVGATEHPCVVGAAAALAEEGHPVRMLPVDRHGQAVVEALPRGTTVVSVMAANHETGVLQPLDAVRDAARSVGAAVHVDATQAAGRVAVELGWARAVTLSSHKLGGPAGMGALVLDSGDAFPAMLPGTQERGRRGGTVNVAGVVGFGAAAASARAALSERTARWRGQQAWLEARLVALGGRVVGAAVPRLPNTTAVVFEGLRGDDLVMGLDLRGVCVSAGAACQSGSQRPSPTLVAMGDPEPAGIVRISQGPATTMDDVVAAAGAVEAVVRGLRAFG